MLKKTSIKIVDTIGNDIIKETTLTRKFVFGIKFKEEFAFYKNEKFEKQTGFKK